MFRVAPWAIPSRTGSGDHGIAGVGTTVGVFFTLNSVMLAECLTG